MDSRSNGPDDTLEKAVAPAGSGDDDRSPSETDETGQSTASEDGWLFDRFEQVTLVRVLVAITVVALALRLVGLGARSAHWDEARVAYWAYFYTDTGSVGYHWEEHGPFVQIVAGRLFEFLGTNDFTARLPVAVVGGLFPLSAYLFREHLRRTEIVALALFLTLNPVLLYYSRFMRSDVLVAAFMFTAFGLLVRYYDTRLLRYVVVAGVFVGLGFASKENASIYLLTWIGGTVLLADQFLHSPASEESGLVRLRDRFEGVAGWSPRFAAIYAVNYLLLAMIGGVIGFIFSSGTLGKVLAVLVFVTLLIVQLLDWDHPLKTFTEYRRRGAVGKVADWVSKSILVVVGFGLSAVLTIVFFFAPRGEGLAARGDPFGPFRPIEDPTTLGEALGNPALLPQLIDDTLRMTYDGYKEWFTDSGETTLSDYLDVLVTGYLDFLVEVMPLLVSLAIIGFVLERYIRRRPRALVMFMCYVGIASVIGYPLGSDIGSDYAWISSHIVVPLAVPASVALASVYRAGRSVLRDNEYGLPALGSLVDGNLGRAQLGSLGMVALVVVAAVGVAFLWMNPLTMVFFNDQGADNELVQYAQPNSDLTPMVDSFDRIADEHDGADVVLYYGERGAQYDSNEALIHKDASTGGQGGWKIHPMCSRWGNTQPLNWYFAATGAEATCERSPQSLSTMIEQDQPPVIVGTAGDSTLGFGENAAQQIPALDSEYDRETYYIRTVGEKIVVYTHESWKE